MYHDDQVESEHDQRPVAGQARKGRLRRGFAAIFWPCVLLFIGASAGFNFRGSLDESLIKQLQNNNSECIGVLKGFVLGRHSRSLNDNVDKGNTLI